jgi:predicted XRE-type DNA-binding protein
LPGLWEISHSVHVESHLGVIVGQSSMRAAIANDVSDVTQLVRTDLRGIFGRVIADAGLSQTQAAKLCSTDQPTLSKVLSGRSDSISSDQLLRWLTQLGCRIDINVQAPHGPGSGTIKAKFYE